MLKELKLYFGTKFLSEKEPFSNIYKLLDYFNREGLYPEKKVFNSSPTEPECFVNGKKVLMFSSNNYLGLALDKEVVEETLKFAKEYGIGPGTSRLLSGNIDIYESLEEELAKLVGKESAIFLSTGYMTNEGLFKALMDPFYSNLKVPYQKGSGAIISDEENHASIISGCKLSTAKKYVFKHNDIKDLEKILSTLPKSMHKIIVTEGSFSLDGVLSPLPKIVEIAKKYHAIVMIDDAHGVGVLGENGGGTASHFGLTKDVDIIMGSCSKALGGMGGFVAGKKKLIDYLRIANRSYMFSSPVSACVAAGLKKGVLLSRNDKDRRKKLYNNYHYLYKNISKLPLKILGDGSIPVIPIVIGNEEKAIKMNKFLFENGIYVEAFRWPAVKEGEAKIRIVPMTHHKKEHLDKLIAVLKLSLQKGIL